MFVFPLEGGGMWSVHWGRRGGERSRAHTAATQSDHSDKLNDWERGIYRDQMKNGTGLRSE